MRRPFLRSPFSDFHRFFSLFFFDCFFLFFFQDSFGNRITILASRLEFSACLRRASGSEAERWASASTASARDRSGVGTDHTICEDSSGVLESDT